MKKVVTSIISAAVALFMALAALAPLSAIKAEASALDITVPEGYNEHDYIAVASFFETEDENGVKNGQKLSSEYDANDPSTWISIDELGAVLEHVFWTDQNGEKRLSGIDIAHLSAIGSLDLSECPYLDYIDATNNALDSVNTHGCTLLSQLFCDGNELGMLDVSENPMLEQLWCDENALSELDVSNNPHLYDLSCNNNLLDTLDLSGNPALLELYCEGNRLSELDLSANSGLTRLWCQRNRLTSLDISHNPDIKRVFCAFNRLTSLDTSANTELYLIDCMNNSISSLDVSMNPQLAELSASGNPLVELKLNEQLCPNTVQIEGSGTFSYHYSIPYSEGFLYASPSENAEFLGWYTESGTLINTSDSIAMFGLSHSVVIAKFTSSGSPVAGDADGNGSVTIADAILVLRCAMGLTDESLIDASAADMDGNGSITVADSISILRLSIGL